MSSFAYQTYNKEFSKNLLATFKVTERTTKNIAKH